MGTMWICKVSSSKNLLRFYLTKQFHGLLDIVFKIDLFREFSTIIERKIHKVDILIWKTYETSSSDSFTFTDKTFNRPDDFRIYLIRFFDFKEFTSFIIDLT